MVSPQIARLIRWIGRIAAGVVLAATLYLLAGWIGSSIPRNGDWSPPQTGGTVIGLETNGVHTALVLPLVTAAKDWREDFPLGDIARPGRPYTHVSISWGEREVFLDTPTWWDLSPRTVLRVLTRGGDALAHVAFYVRPARSDSLRPIRITDAQYRRLVESIEVHLATPEPRRRFPGYGAGDVFYEAGGRYTAVNTCNQWTSSRLADAGIRTGGWTPLAGGVMKWVPALPDGQALDRPILPAAARQP